MRILISTGLFPNRADPQRGVYILRQAVALRRLADVQVIAPVPFAPGFITSRRYSRYARVPDQDRLNDIDVVYPRYYILPKVCRFHHGPALTASVFNTFLRTARAFRPDVILGFFAYPYGYAAVQIGKALKLPVAVGVLGSDVNVMAKRGLRRPMIRWALRASERVFSVSRALKDEVVALGVPPEKIVVIPNGVDPEGVSRLSRADARATLGLPPASDFVVCVANLVHVKGVDLVIRAMERLRDDNISLVVVGDGEKREELTMLVAELGLEQQVRFVGARPPWEVGVWMAAAELVVLGSRAEGHPNVVVEALASGRPVVATRVGGVGELISSPDLGILVDREDPQALGSAMREALSKRWDEASIRRTGLRRTWDDVAREIVEELHRMPRGNHEGFSPSV